MEGSDCHDDVNEERESGERVVNTRTYKYANT